MSGSKDDKPARAPRVEAEVSVEASREEVWEALSTGPGLQRWFAPQAAVTPGPEGSVTVGWAPGEDWTSRIDVWEPNARLVISSEMPGKDGSLVRLAVEFRIETGAGVTRVRLVHSGFGGDGSWDDMIDGTEAGWAYFLLNLKHCLERHPGTPRTVVSARPRCGAGIDDGLAAILGDAGLGLRDGALALGKADLHPGRACSLRLGEDRFEARVLTTRLPRTLAFVVPPLADGLLFLERESLKPTFTLGVWLSLYGLPEDRVRDLRAQVGGFTERLGRALPVAAEAAPGQA